MFSSLVYDIPSNEQGTKRRNKLYKLCSQYGFHVQNSVFELDIDYAKLIKLQNQINTIIDKNVDSIRIYNLGTNRTDANTILLGHKEFIESNDSFII